MCLKIGCSSQTRFRHETGSQEANPLQNLPPGRYEPPEKIPHGPGAWKAFILMENADNVYYSFIYAILFKKVLECRPGKQVLGQREVAVLRSFFAVRFLYYVCTAAWRCTHACRTKKLGVTLQHLFSLGGGHPPPKTPQTWRIGARDALKNDQI